MVTTRFWPQLHFEKCLSQQHCTSLYHRRLEGCLKSLVEKQTFPTSRQNKCGQTRSRLPHRTHFRLVNGIIVSWNAKDLALPKVLLVDCWPSNPHNFVVLLPKRRARFQVQKVGGSCHNLPFLVPLFLHIHTLAYLVSGFRLVFFDAIDRITLVHLGYINE